MPSIFARIHAFPTHGFAAILLATSFIASLPHQSVADGPADSSKFIPAEPTSPAEWFGQTIRDSKHLTPAQEASGFHLPKGFEVDLIASEPTIAKPLNLAFDSAGKLWVTQSVQYPFPAPLNEPGQDSIMVLTDTDRDGTFETAKQFADGLNIPIGILPYRDGVICFSIPNIYWLRDTDNDGVCDQREVILGPFDTTRDTHGMINSLRWGNDGWIYACHGFNNQSKIAGKDGHVVEMNSGNTFRFKPDGSRAELYTQGQVNPFGMTYDKWGDLYSADCHSKPISQLLRGGCYPSFGRPDIGLGFIPSMMEHLHGSTAIAGLAYMDGSSFPEEFNENFLSGNVMTCRINRNRLEYTGATARAVEMPDLLTSDDPWFRPVDLQLGPDGALYIADFYNKIIGHYEVPLTHPDRDRTSGRIWRVRWKGDSPNSNTQVENLNSLRLASQQRQTEPNNSTAGNDAKWLGAIAELKQAKQPNQKAKTERRLAILRTSYAAQKGAVPAEWLRDLSLDTPIDSKAILDSFATHHAGQNSPAITKSLQLIQEFADRCSPKQTQSAMPLRAAIQAIGAAGSPNNVSWLLKKSETIDEKSDPILYQASLIAVRNILVNTMEKGGDIPTGATLLGETKETPLSSSRGRALLRIIASIPMPQATTLGLNMIDEAIKETPSESQLASLREAIDRLSTNIAESDAPRLLRIMQRVFPDTNQFADQVLLLAQRQQQQRGNVLPAIRTQGQLLVSTIADDLLVSLKPRQAAGLTDNGTFQLTTWVGRGAGKNDQREWPTELREVEPSTDANAEPTNGRLPFVSSLGLSESYVGSWTSNPFTAPSKLRFRIVGHNGLPTDPDHHKNFVRLLSTASDSQGVTELQKAFPPRSDIGRWVEWDLTEHVGKLVQLQVVDGDAGGSYAWIGIGQISKPGLSSDDRTDRWKRLTGFVDRFGWSQEAAPSLDRLFSSNAIDWFGKARLNRVRFADSRPAIAELIDLANAQGWHDLLLPLQSNSDTAAAYDWNAVDASVIRTVASSIAKRCSAADQDALASKLANHKNSWELLADLCESGALSSESLRGMPTTWWEALDAQKATRLLALRPTSSTASQRQSIVQTKLAAVRDIPADLTVGAKVFADRCSVCHRLAGVGKVIGPQLEGVGARGADRLCEDILWPDRNVDEAFRMSTVLMDDGRVLTGLITNRKEDSLDITDQQGNKTTISISEIENEKPSMLSLMPGNFEEVINDSDFAALLGYLKATASKKP